MTDHNDATPTEMATGIAIRRINADGSVEAISAADFYAPPPLEPCPHCGARGEIIERHNPMSKWKWSVDCKSSTCGASGPVEASPADAIAAWNTRLASTAALQAERDALSELVGAAYVVVGILAEHTRLFDHPSVTRALDALSDQRETKPLLPWPHEPLPDMSERDALAARVDALEGHLSVIITKLHNGKNAPGHGHDIPGVWDVDASNGERGGQPCEWCAQWDAARDALGEG